MAAASAPAASPMHGKGMFARCACGIMASLSLFLPTTTGLARTSLVTAAPQSGDRHQPWKAPDARSTYGDVVAEAAQRFGIARDWIWAVMRVESAGQPRVVSHAGAMGMMQLMPATWASLAARHGLGSDPFDIRANILAGAAYLRAMLDRYGDLSTALAAYNAGPARVDGWRKGTQSLPAETQAYVARIAPALQGGRMPIAGARSEPVRSWRDASLFTRRPDRPSIGAGEDEAPHPVSAAILPSRDERPSLTPSRPGFFLPLSGRITP